MRLIHIAAVAALAMIVGLPRAAFAESYVRGNYAQTTVKFDSDNIIPKKSDGPAISLDGRYDFEGTPFFGTAELFQDKSESNDRFLGRQTTKSTGYAGGLGLVFSSSAVYEAWARLGYTHARSKFDSEAFGSDHYSSDVGTLAAGVYRWVHPLVKVYGEARFDKPSQKHHTHAYGAMLGTEVKVIEGLRLYVEGGYGKIESYGDSLTATSIGGGIKIPFGMPAAAIPAPAAERAVSAAAMARVATPPPAAMAPAAPPLIAAAGDTAKLKDGVQLRAQPKLDAPTLTSDASEAVTLKAEVANAGGKWWLVSTSKGIGWVLESDITVQP